MPRTKVKSNATAKRPRTTRQPNEPKTQSKALEELDKKADAYQTESELVHAQVIDKINNTIQDIRKQLNPNFLRMTLHELFTCQHVIHNNAVDITTLNYTKASRGTVTSDEGYMTEVSCHSTMTGTRAAIRRPLGPLASAKAKLQRLRSRSAQANQSQPSLAGPSEQHRSHQSRATGRTPLATPLPPPPRTTMSQDRICTVTPRVQAANRAVSMLRYQRIGETVISMDGSPVIAQSVSGLDANINIPVDNGVISIVPSAMSHVEPRFLANLNPDTLRQLHVLRSNLNLMMSQLE